MIDNVGEDDFIVTEGASDGSELGTLVEGASDGRRLGIPLGKLDSVAVGW